MTTPKKKSKGIAKKLLHKYRLVILNEDTFEERVSFKLNRLNVFVFSTLLSLFLVGITTVIIAFTPLREYIPGYSSIQLKKQAAELTYKTDSMQQVLYFNDQYLSSIKRVLTGDLQIQQINKDSIIKTITEDPQNINFSPSKKDSILRDKVAKEDKYNVFEPSSNMITSVLFPPANGPISEGYNLKTKHYAVDIVVEENTPVKATAAGTVIFAEWTVETGFVIILEHHNNLISVYKHNASLIKQQGDLVKAGEVIAAAGSSGEYSTGPHIHFELWSNGYPINPTNFIDFE
ncbi:MAG: peptidase M23 [Bacteroidetes bacterium HGW-Bacteroidetes-2]|jgi:murein DD-endopeptidase MepM/ murein hydrolase activator NlpD|nr:MAG: peptidase M23 [Bacteroidetes bacterium HGW-Bacteroidetes-2]